MAKKDLFIIRYKKVSGVDRTGNRLIRDDVVKIVHGPNIGKKGRIMYIQKNVVFITGEDFSDTGGLIAERDSNIEILGKELITAQGNYRQKANRFFTKTNNSNGTENSTGKNISICKGAYKGHKGRVISIMGNNIKVQLQINCRELIVNQDMIYVHDEEGEFDDEYDQNPESQVVDEELDRMLPEGDGEEKEWGNNSQN